MNILCKGFRALVCLGLCCLLLGLIPEAWAEQGPAIVLEGAQELDWVCGVPYTEPGYTAWNAEEKDYTSYVRVHGKVKTWLVGDYELQYRLDFMDGQSVTARRLVHVLPGPELPETEAQEKTIYLTFDDGPSDFTEEVLDILARYEIKATFFVVASSSRCEEILPRIVEEGHTLGLHAYRHRIAELYQSWDNYFSDLMKGQEVLHEITGEYARLVRMPGGSRSAAPLIGTLKGRQAQFEEIMHTMGLRYVDWNIQPETGATDSEGVYYRFTHPSKPYDSVVVLLHDTRHYSVLALERMIQWGLDQGYRFAPLDLTTPEVHSQLEF